MGDFDAIPPERSSSNVNGNDDGDDDKHGAGGVEPESEAIALSDVLQIDDENVGGGDFNFGHDGDFGTGQDDGDDDDGFHDDGDRSPLGTNSNGHRRFGRVDSPLRVEPPPSFNAPARPVDQTQDQQIKARPTHSLIDRCLCHAEGASAFSPSAFTMRKSSTASLVGSLRQRQEPKKRDLTENHASYRIAMSDYNMLAFSSQRSGRHEMEGLAYYSAGVTMDSMGQYPKAIENYKKFLAVCKTLKDLFIEGVCHNCMGVDYMLMACPPASNMQPALDVTKEKENTTGLPARAVALLRKALEHHEEHLKGADDAGSGVAHSNIGLCHGLMGDYPKAAKHHQEALRVALRVQSVAAGNLGTLAARQGDMQTAQACLEQHLQLVQQLGDWQGEINAWWKMAQVAAAAAKGGQNGGGGGGGGGGQETESVREGSGGGGASGGSLPRVEVGPEHGADRLGGGGRMAGAGAGAPGGQEEAVVRALWCFERAAALAKTHDKAKRVKDSLRACTC
ncbi:unnamed protein product [Ectocarpus sp. CCAP 1310/34]|nr:unnamed protein product [Ectocarpus sp. CCAP 1310/34]